MLLSSSLTCLALLLFFLFALNTCRLFDSRLIGFFIYPSQQWSKCKYTTGKIKSRRHVYAKTRNNRVTSDTLEWYCFQVSLTCHMMCRKVPLAANNHWTRLFTATNYTAYKSCIVNWIQVKRVILDDMSDFSCFLSFAHIAFLRVVYLISHLGNANTNLVCWWVTLLTCLLYWHSFNLTACLTITELQLATVLAVTFFSSLLLYSE